MNNSSSPSDNFNLPLREEPTLASAIANKAISHVSHRSRRSFRKDAKHCHVAHRGFGAALTSVPDIGHDVPSIAIRHSFSFLEKPLQIWAFGNMTVENVPAIFGEKLENLTGSSAVNQLIRAQNNILAGLSDAHILDVGLDSIFGADLD